MVIYTVITGSYDDPPTVSHHDPSITYLCFADELEHVPEPWKLIRIPSYFEDSKLTSGYLKAMPQLVLPENSVAVWVDANLKELRLEASVMAELVAKRPVATLSHRERQTVRAEAAAISERRLDHPIRPARLLQHLADVGFPDDRGLSATMLLVRDLASPEVRRANELWWDGIATFSRRDQLTFNFALWLANLRWREVDVDYRQPNRYFTRVPHRVPTGRQLPASSVTSVDTGWLRPRMPPLPDGYPDLAVWHGERWESETSQLLRRLNLIIEQLGEPLEGNYCHHHKDVVGPHTPPDIRRSWKREFLRQAASCCSRGLEIGFNGGHSAALLLGSNPGLQLHSVDLGEHAYSMPCADEILAAYPGRHTATWGPSESVLPGLPVSLVEQLDFVHVDGGHGEEEFASDLEWFLQKVPIGCLLLVDDSYVDTIGHPLDEACRAGQLVEMVPGLPSSGENRLFKKAR